MARLWHARDQPPLASRSRRPINKRLGVYAYAQRRADCERNSPRRRRWWRWTSEPERREARRRCCCDAGDATKAACWWKALPSLRRKDIEGRCYAGGYIGDEECHGWRKAEDHRHNRNWHANLDEKSTQSNRLREKRACSATSPRHTPRLSIATSILLRAGL